MMMSRTAGLKALRDAASHITIDDLCSADSSSREKLYSNPFKYVFYILEGILMQHDQEEKGREAIKTKEAKAAKEAKTSTNANVPSTFESGLYGTQLGVSGTRGPNTLPTTATPTKRKVSETTFGTQSTETTPTKMTSPEASIQNLQNQLVNEVLLALYHNVAVPVSWAKNRKFMQIRYTPFVHSCGRNLTAGLSSLILSAASLTIRRICTIVSR
jgi:hypothetical protein